MINVLFCGNDKVFDGMLTCIISILKRTKATEPFNFYIYTMERLDLDANYKKVSDEHISFLSNYIKQYNKDNKVSLIDVTNIYNKEFSNSPNEHCYCTPYTLLRLFADIVDGMPDQLLYLDCDMLFNRDILELYSVDISNYEYAAARDHYGKFLVNPNYINAGMLYLNLKKIKDTGLLLKARNLIRRRHLPFADQSAIIRTTTTKKMLSQKYNDQKHLRKKTVIRHFAKRLFWTPYPHVANIKQWNVEMMHKKYKYHQFDDVLDEYINLKKKYENETREGK